MSNSTVSGKVYGGVSGVGIAGPLAVLIMYVIRAVFHADPPPEVDQAVTTLISVVAGFIGAYVAPHQAEPTPPPAP